MVKHLKQNSSHTIIAQIISSWQAIISTFTPSPLDETPISIQSYPLALSWQFKHIHLYSLVERGTGNESKVWPPTTLKGESARARNQTSQPRVQHTDHAASPKDKSCWLSKKYILENSNTISVSFHLAYLHFFALQSKLLLNGYNINIAWKIACYNYNNGSLPT